MMKRKNKNTTEKERGERKKIKQEKILQGYLTCLTHSLLINEPVKRFPCIFT